MKVVIFLALFVAAATAHTALDTLAKNVGKHPQWPAFVTFALKHGRNYGGIEEAAQRFENFVANEKRNVELRKLNPQATFGVNKFSDISQAEFAKMYLTLNMTGKPKNLPKYWPQKHMIPPVKRVNGVPNDVDWFAAGKCTPVKDQGQCGSCWAFSATETIESAIAMKQGSPPTLAPEEIVDCDVNGSDQGCNGGDPRSAMSFVASEGGLDTEESYPYTAGQSGSGGSCQFSSGNVGGSTNGPQDVSDGDENALQSFLQSSGPPSVCVDASSWQSYTGGVMSSCGCNIDHAVQATGITSQFGSPAFIVRNSWNTDWGVNGFIYLAIGNNVCCVANEVSWAT
jgi:C1A family cysteine protease